MVKYSGKGLGRRDKKEASEGRKERTCDWRGAARGAARQLGPAVLRKEKAANALVVSSETCKEP